MTESIVIANGLVFDPNLPDLKKLDLRIENGVLSEFSENLEPAKTDVVFDATGLWVSPGFIDLHTHLRDLGQSNREDIFTGTLAAAAGGFTTVLAMANTDPPIDNALILSRIKQLIAERACIEVVPVACVTKNMKGEELTNMVELASMGAGAFSDDGMPITNLAVLRRALEYSELAQRLIISHAEDKDLAGKGSINESPSSTRLGLPPIPSAAESACVAREIEIARLTGARLHFAHISTAASVELIANAKRAGLRVTADCTPHHLALTDENIVEFDTSYKMNPPLRSEIDRQALIAGLKDGTIDAIATDHAPHSRSDKAKTFDQAPFGVIGLETAFSLAYEQLVLSKHLTAEQLLRLFVSKPASILNREVHLRVGQTANFAILNPAREWIYDAEKGYSKSCNSPFSGKKLIGKNLITIYGGAVVYKDEAFTSDRTHAFS